VLTAADENTAIAVDVVPGQVHEASQLGPMLDATTARVPDFEEAVGDKGFDGEPQRQACRDRDIKPVIPYKTNCTKPGRLNKKAYRERNMIERLIGKLKEFRRIATRYEKLRQTFLGIIHLALGFIRLKRLLIVNRA
jgi:transposase